MSIEAKKDRGLTFLLDLDGEIQEQGNGFWIKFSIWQVPMSEHIPHGIRYSLSLHDPYGKRLMGFDNAHAVKPGNSRFNYAGRKLPFDHQHRHISDKGIAYQFSSAYQLLADFYAEADRVLNEMNR